MARGRWSADEFAKLIELRGQRMRNKAIALELGRRPDAVETKIRLLIADGTLESRKSGAKFCCICGAETERSRKYCQSCRPVGKRMTERERDRAVGMYRDGFTYAEIAVALRRSENSVAWLIMSLRRSGALGRRLRRAEILVPDCVRLWNAGQSAPDIARELRLTEHGVHYRLNLARRAGVDVADHPNAAAVAKSHSRAETRNKISATVTSIWHERPEWGAARRADWHAWIKVRHTPRQKFISALRWLLTDVSRERAGEIADGYFPMSVSSGQTQP